MAGGNVRYDVEHKERTRARVLQEAAKAIRAEGPHRIGVAGVMAKAGLTHGGFYAHFTSKDELVLAAVEEMFASARGTFDRYTRDVAPEEGLRTYVRFYLSRAHRDARDFGCPLPVLSSDLPRLSDPVRAQFAEGVARLTSAIAGLLKQIERFRHDCDVDALAASVLAEMIGALSLARAIADPAQSDAILSRSRAEIVKRLGLGLSLTINAGVRP